MSSPKEGQEEYQEAAEKGGGRHLDSELHEKYHDRSYNPINDAERGKFSEKLNNDAGRMRKGPQPI